MQNHPLRVLKMFLEQEKAYETAKKYGDMRFVGYVLDIGYDEITIITSDPFKLNVGGVPRNSLLIMVPSDMSSLPPHFTLLRVLESAPTPLTQAVQQTYFELQKKSMPELDVFTQSELQWGALKTSVLGMFYPCPDQQNAVEFSGDLNNFVSAHKYRVYSPDQALLDLIVNSLVAQNGWFKLGDLRLTECRLALPTKPRPNVDVYVNPRDFMGARTAMFGKTRLGKSNVVKLIAQSLLAATATSKNVGQLIFDINGEYANDNPQDGNKSLASAFPNRCVIYALSPKPSTPSRPLKLNFYEQPDASHRVIQSLLREDGKLGSIYVNSFANVELVSLDDYKKITQVSDQVRALRKLQYYWAILHEANFVADEQALIKVAPSAGSVASKLDPGFAAALRTDAYRAISSTSAPRDPKSLDELVVELKTIFQFYGLNPNHAAFTSQSGKPLFDQDDLALLGFLYPAPGRGGVALLAPYRKYHDPKAGNFVKDILSLLDTGETVILDLGNANEEVMRYFSNELSVAVFHHQLDKFTSNKLNDHFIQLYFEEAHNLFPNKEEPRDTYARFAKEGAKYHIGMVYSTQSPTTVYRDLLAQTENFFIAHLSSRDEVAALARLNVAYQSLQDDILMAKTPGYMRMLTRSHRFVVPVQAKKFTP